MTQTLSQQQISRAQRAADQRGDYTCRGGEVFGRACVYVTKHKKGVAVTCYTVSFRAAGLPVCNCPDSLRHRGTSLVCKHAVLAIKHRQEQPAPETVEPEPATISEEEWNEWQREFSEDRLPWAAPPFDQAPGEPVETPAADAFRKRHAQALRDRALWD